MVVLPNIGKHEWVRESQCSEPGGKFSGTSDLEVVSYGLPRGSAAE